jgi:CHAD domain-containing protein
MEYVHEMRVALRRLRASLRTFKKALDGPLKAFKDELKWLAGELGDVRDMDVFLGFLNDYDQQADEAHHPFLQRLIRSVRRQRRSHYRTMLDIFASERYNSFVETYYPMVRCPAGKKDALIPLAGHGTLRVADHAPELLRKPLERAMAYGRRLDALDAETQHRLRIACKRLRYTAEFLADLYPKGKRTIVKPMTEMQDALGDVHDADVYHERVEGFCRRSRASDPAATAAREALFEHLKQRRSEALEQAQSVWKQFTRKKTQTRVAQAIEAPRQT